MPSILDVKWGGSGWRIGSGIRKISFKILCDNILRIIRVF